MRACERCHSRKTKCDRRMPSCTSCTKGQVQCQYPSKWHDRQLRQEYIKSVERRLRELENENARLRGRDAGPDDTPMADTPQADTPQADNAAGITEAEQEAAMIMALAAAGTDFGGQPQPQPPAAGRPATTVIAVTISTAISVAVTNSYTPFVTDATAAPISSGIAVFPTISASTPDLSSATTTTATTSHPSLVSRLSPTQSSSSHRTPGEEARYLGSSNGVEFTDVVERVIDGSSHDGGNSIGASGAGSSTFGRLGDSRRGHGYGYGGANGCTADMIHSAPPTGGNSNSERVAIPCAANPPMTLVDEAIAMPLVESYFAHWHLTFPLLHRPMFMRMVRDLYADPQRYQQDPAGGFAFDIVLALGAVPAKRHLEWGLGFGDAERHFARALARLDAVAALRDIRALQALLLYSKYGIHASLRDTSSELWEALGQATQLVVELGLHQTGAAGPTSAAAARLLSRCDVHITGPLPAPIRVEMQRRSFWCYYNLETIVNISLGRPLAIHDDDIDVPLPSTAGDDDIGQGGMTTTGSTVENNAADGNEHGPSLPTSSPPARTSLFLHHIHYRRLQARIHRCMYTSRSVQVQPLHERRATRREIYKSLQEWHQRTELLNLQQYHRSDQTIRSSFLHLSWYHALYHSACLMLFRPSTAFPALERIFEERSSGVEGDEDGNYAGNSVDNVADDPLHILWTASRGVLHRYGELLRARHFNYSWITLYTVFMAGLANVYAVGCCAQRWKRWCHQIYRHEPTDAATGYSVGANTATPRLSPFMPALLDVVCDFRDCSNILTAISERWNDARAPYDTFTRLSMSAMQELATVTCRSNNRSCVCAMGRADCVPAEADGRTSIDTGSQQQPGPMPLPLLQPQQQSLALPSTLPVHDSYASAGVDASPGFSAIYSVSMDDTFTPDHALADYYSMVDFQQLFQDI